MKRIFIGVILLVGLIGALVFFTRDIFSTSQVSRPTISIFPQTILPGDPVFIKIDATSSPKKLLVDSASTPIFNYNGKPRALIAIDFNAKNATHTVEVIFSDGSTLTKQFIITPRTKIEKPLGIPEKLGGNTQIAVTNLLANLARENAILNTIPSATISLWTKAFSGPLDDLQVTDDYGYDRNTDGSTIVHKGTDFHAPEGTPVMAMNDGVVKIAQTFIVYGNTIVIDHGLGLQTLYMHLSKINVSEGDVVRTGQVIGLSGQTGYADQPHLHISVKIGGISVDPMVFLEFFK